MHVWPVQDAKARFSELLDACVTDGPQVVSRRGTETAALVPIDEWRRLQAAARPSLKQLLLADSARTDMLVIESWLDLVTSSYNVLPMDGPAFRCWTKLMHRTSDTLYEHAMIAAIAKVKGLTVVTRNVSDFSSFDIGLFNPFEFGSKPGVT